MTTTERPDPVFGAAAVSGWPPGTVDHLVRLGLLTETDPAAAAACTACDFDHVEPVQWVREPGLPARACVACARGGVLWLNPDDLRRWVVRLPVLARLVASAVGAAGGTVERVPGRVWKLGTVRAGGRAWVGALAVGLTRADAAGVIESAPELRAANALVFVPSTVPPGAIWSADRAPVVVSLLDVLTLTPSGLSADREVLASALPASHRPVPKAPRRVFATPPGTTWEQITFTVEEHHVRVRVGETVERYGFAEAGFEDRREKGTPDEVWVVLRALARFRGVLGTRDGTTTKAGSLKQKLSTLRERLRALVALDGDPFHRTRRGQPYRARFTIGTDGPATFPTPPGTTWDDLTLTEVDAGIVEIGTAVEERGAGYTPGDGDERGRWEGTMTVGERRWQYPLIDLIGADNFKPLGDSLVAVLRAGGRVSLPANDPNMPALGAALARFFQLTNPPFAFDSKRRAWIARFEGTSLVSASDR
jgi:hypothetical protein